MKWNRGQPKCITGLLTVALLLSAQAGLAQRVWRFQHLDVENGLPNNVVTSIAEDDRGFVWFGTQSGLARYDGQRLRVYRHRAHDPASLSGDFILALYVDGQGNLWVATDAHGVNRYEAQRGQWTHFLEDPKRYGLQANLSVHYMLEDAEGRMWLGTIKQGIARLDPATGVVERLQADAGNPNSLSGNHITDLYRDVRGEIWVATESGLNRYRPGSNDFQVLLRDRKATRGVIRHLAGSADGRLWLAGVHGLMRFSPSAGGLQHFPGMAAATSEDRRPTALVGDGAGGVWLGMLGQGLLHLEENGGHTAIRARSGWRHGLSEDGIRTLYMDAERRLWVGSDLGVDMITARARDFASFQMPPDVESGENVSLVRAVYARAPDEVWLGVGSGVRRISETGAVLQTLHPGKGLPAGSINALAGDKQGRIWIAGDGGLASYDVATSRVAPVRSLFPEPPGSGNVRRRLLSIMVSDSGAIWVGANGAGVVVHEPGKGTLRRLVPGPAEAGGLTDGEVLAMAEQEQSVWIGTWRGLNRYHPESGAMQHYTHDAGDGESLSHNTVSSIWIDAKNRVWVGTFGGGLNRFVPGDEHFVHFDSEDGLADNGIYAIIGDGDGRLWISTNHGLTRFDPETREAVSFHAEDGLQGEQFRWGAVNKDARGRIYFGGLHGLTRFDPAHIRVNRQAPVPILVEVRANEQVIQLSPASARRSGQATQKVVLDHRDNLLGMDFAAPRSNAKLRFSYRLLGLHENWVQTAPGQASATYAQVTPGTYHFQLRARSASSAWSEVRTVLDIRIIPSPWRTPWAYAAYLVLGFSMVAVIAKERIRHMRSERAAAKAIQASEERLSLALWGSRNQMWDWDANSNVMHRAHGLPGFALAAEESGLDVASILKSIHPEDQVSCSAVIDLAMRGEADDFEITYRRRNAQGEWVWVQDRARVSARDSDGSPLRITGTMQDISELKRNEAALRALNRTLEERARERSQQLQRAYEELAESEKLASLGTMVAGVAHEINTPIGIGVTAASHIGKIAEEFERTVQSGALRRSELDAFRTAMREGSELVLRNLQRAASLVRSFKQVAVDQSSERRREFDLGMALNDVLASLGPQLSRKTVRVAVNCPQSLLLDSYPGALYQVISNMVSNALMHGFADRKAGEIHIDVAAFADRIEVSFADDGVGMDAATRRRVFEPFFTSRLGQGGSGLGLHIVHNLVTQVLGGTIHCDSEPGEGARFRFSMARDPGRASRAPDQPVKE